MVFKAMFREEAPPEGIGIQDILFHVSVDLQGDIGRVPVRTGGNGNRPDNAVHASVMLRVGVIEEVGHYFSYSVSVMPRPSVPDSSSTVYGPYTVG